MTPTIGHGLCAGAEWIRTFSSALDRRRFRGFVRVGSIYRRPGHPSTCRPRHTIELSQGGPRSRHSPRGLGGVGGASASRNRRFDPSLSSAESANYRLIAQRATREGTCGPPWAIRGPAVATHCQSRPSRAVARCRPARRDRDRRWPAMSRLWRRRAMPRVAHRAMPHTQPAA